MASSSSLKARGVLKSLIEEHALNASLITYLQQLLLYLLK